MNFNDFQQRWAGDNVRRLDRCRQRNAVQRLRRHGCHHRSNPVVLHRMHNVRSEHSDRCARCKTGGASERLAVDLRLLLDRQQHGRGVDVDRQLRPRDRTTQRARTRQRERARVISIVSFGDPPSGCPVLWISQQNFYTALRRQRAGAAAVKGSRGAKQDPLRHLSPRHDTRHPSAGFARAGGKSGVK
jgi:hypothetical protein